jgi:hypothetical protein
VAVVLLDRDLHLHLADRHQHSLAQRRRRLLGARACDQRLDDDVEVIGLEARCAVVEVISPSMNR